MSPVVRSLPTDLSLKRGAHSSPDDGMCVMEAVAYVAGEPHSDAPTCACPVIGAFMRSWNDCLTDADRDRILAPYITRLVGSRSTSDVELRRSYLAFDWLIREQLAAWLSLTPALAERAVALRALPPLVTAAAVRSVVPLLREAQQDAATARAAASDAASDAAWDAAWAAAGDPASKALAPTRDQLQVSACALIDRMLAVTPESLALGNPMEAQ